jgi:short-subunit dehydrogenase
MIIELESTGIKVNLVSPGFTKTNLNGCEGMESVEQGSREVVRVALLGPDGPSGTFTRSENATIPWRSGKAETHRSAHRQLRRHICAAAQPPKAPRRASGAENSGNLPSFVSAGYGVLLMLGRMSWESP